MKPQDLIDFRTRMGWSQAELARQLGLSASRIGDYERGRTAGRHARPAPIPKIVELACRHLKSEAERVTPWPNTSNLPANRPHLPSGGKL